MTIKLDCAIINVPDNMEYQIRLHEQDDSLGIVLETTGRTVELIEHRSKSRVWNDILELLLDRLTDSLEQGDRILSVSSVFAELIHELYENVIDREEDNNE